MNTIALRTQRLGLRFNHEEFCDDAKTHRETFVQLLRLAQAAFLSAG
jgi:hypothetical protein